MTKITLVDYDNNPIFQEDTEALKDAMSAALIRVQGAVSHLEGESSPITLLMAVAYMQGSMDMIIEQEKEAAGRDMKPVKVELKKRVQPAVPKKTIH